MENSEKVSQNYPLVVTSPYFFQPCRPVRHMCKDPDEITHNERLIRIHAVSNSVLIFWRRPLFGTMILTRFKDGRDNFRNTGMKGLTSFLIDNMVFTINIWLPRHFTILSYNLNNSTSLTVNVLKVQTPKFLANAICKQCRPRSDCSRRSSLIRVFTVCHSTKHFKRQLHKKQNLNEKSME